MILLWPKRKISQAKREDSTYAKIDQKWYTFRGGGSIFYPTVIDVLNIPKWQWCYNFLLIILLTYTVYSVRLNTFYWIGLKTKNSTKRQQSCHLVNCLVFFSAFGRHRDLLEPVTWLSSSIIILRSMLEEGFYKTLEGWWCLMIVM